MEFYVEIKLWICPGARRCFKTSASKLILNECRSRFFVCPLVLGDTYRIPVFLFQSSASSFHPESDSYHVQEQFKVSLRTCTVRTTQGAPSLQLSVLLLDPQSIDKQHTSQLPRVLRALASNAHLRKALQLFYSWY